MSDTKTKACNLTQDEISEVIASYGRKLGSRDFSDADIERIKYLNQRLKTFSEGETKSDNNAAGWSSGNG